MKHESGMYSRLTIVCGVQSGLCVQCGRDQDSFIPFLKRVSNLGQKVSGVVIFGVIYLCSSSTSVLVVVVP